MHECITNQGLFIACESLYGTASLYSAFMHRSQPDMGSRTEPECTTTVRQQPEREREKKRTDKKGTGRINLN